MKRGSPTKAWKTPMPRGLGGSCEDALMRWDWFYRISRVERGNRFSAPPNYSRDYYDTEPRRYPYPDTLLLYDPFA